jgi:5,10-methylene-tetrahydrofolate dehydrogenase/methenyl tetrahydrofolate cyclohydrolase
MGTINPLLNFVLQHMNEEKILTGVSIEKDVDGVHPLNIGRLVMQGRDPLFVPCTPKGCIKLLHRHNIDIKGEKAVVIGRSNIVGMPAALLLQVLLLTYNGFMLVYIGLCSIVSLWLIC